MAKPGSPSSDERRTLERQLQLKDQAMMKLSEELRETREKLVAAEFDARNKAAELKTVREELKRSSRPATAKSETRTSRAGAPEDASMRLVPFEHLTDLENQIRARDKELKELRAHCDMLERQMKVKEKEILKLAKSAETGSTVPLAEHARLEGELRAVKKKLEEAQEENRTLAQIEHAKTAVIEKLSNELEARKAGGDIVTELQNQLASRDRTIQRLEEELSTLQRVLQQRDIALEHLTSADVTRDERAAWVEERRTLEGHKRKALERVAALERTIKTLETRLQTQQQRIGTFVKVMREAPVREPIDLSEPVAVPDGETAVPAEMYAALEAAVQKLQAAVHERDAMVAERDDTIFGLQRKTEVLQKANASLERRLALDTAELRLRIDQLTEEAARREERLKVAEREAEAVRHGKAAALKQSKRQENELYGEIADLRLSLQRREAELAQLESTLKREAEELRSTLGEENARLKAQLEEVLALHEDIRHHRDEARCAKVAVVVCTQLGAVRTAAETLIEGVRAASGAEAVLMRVPSAEVPAPVADLPAASIEQLVDVDAVVLGAPAAQALPDDMRVFLEQAAAAWPAGALAGKIGAAFTAPELSDTSAGQSGTFSALRGSLSALQQALLLHGAALLAETREGDEAQALRALGMHVGDAAHKLLVGSKEGK